MTEIYTMVIKMSPHKRGPHKNFTLQKQGNRIQGKAQLALKNRKNLFGDQRKVSLTSFEECYLL